MMWPAGGGTLELSVEATSYVPFHRLEVVLNGKVVASREEAGGTRQMKLAEKVSVQGSGWLAARCGSRAQAVLSAPAAAYFLKLIEGTQTYVERLATRPDGQRLERIVKVLGEAHARLHGRIEKRGAGY